MVHTAAHLVEHVFPQLPVRQWVISFPKRLRYFLHRDTALTGRVLRVWLRVVEARLRACCPHAPPGARFGAVSFIQRFGSTLNAHLHIHVCVIDGVFSLDPDSSLRFHRATALPDTDIAALEHTTRDRVLRLFEREGLLAPETVEQMRAGEHSGGFSLDASVCVAARDRAGLERLLRYCARPPLASGRLSWEHDPGDEPASHLTPPVLYHLAKPDREGRTVIALTPFELLDRLAVLIPPPRKHRHRYHGVLAPNSALRPAVSARAGLPIDSPELGQTAHRSPARPPEPRLTVRATALWAFLIARIYQALPLVCPNCGHPLRLIALITEPATVVHILEHLELPTTPPPLACARGPPPELGDQTPEFDLTTPQPVPDFEFDQTRSW